jgi:hypothetical protein
LHEQVEASLLRTNADFEERLIRLEKGNTKAPWKSVTDRASAAALFLGLVLSATSLYEAIWTKPRADRIAAIGQFNQAINAAVKVEQDASQQADPTATPQARLAVEGALTPQFLNDLATAKSIMPELRESDIGVPQLVILINGALQFNDIPSAKFFADKAVTKTDAPPYARSEAYRFQAKVYFAMNDPKDARSAYGMAVAVLIPADLSASPRAYVLADWLAAEYQLGSCSVAADNLMKFENVVRSPYMNAQMRYDLKQSLSALPAQNPRHCPAALLSALQNLATEQD